MALAFGVWVSVFISFSLLMGAGYTVHASLPLDNLPLQIQATPNIYSPDNFNLLHIEDKVDTLDCVEPAPLLSWAEYYGTQNLLYVRNAEPLPLKGNNPAWWLLSLLSLSLAGFAYARNNFPYKTRQYFWAVVSARHFSQLEREGGFFKESATWILFGIFLFSIAALIYETILQYAPVLIPSGLNDYLAFALIVVGLLVFFGYKGLLNAYLAWVFQTHQAKRAYSTNVFLYNNIVGLVLLPIVLINLYNPSEVLLASGWAVFLLLNIIKFIKGMMVGSIRSKYSVYYFLLYLCTVEILPLLIIARLAGIDVFPG